MGLEVPLSKDAEEPRQPHLHSPGKSGKGDFLVEKVSGVK